jgi:glycosyltransferase involved in cell wall biosynthesis
VLVPNGFDKDDFSVPVSARGNRFRLVYSGTSNAVHTPEPFFRGAGIALRRRPELLEQMEVFFVGAVSDLDFEGMVHRNGLQGIVRTLGYVRHADSVGYLMSADLLVLTVPALSSEGVVTGKLYEYLASGKPILSVVPEGEAKRIVQRLKRGPVAAPDRPDAIADALIRCYDEWKRGRLRIGLPRFAGLEPYDRKLQAGVMARLFDGMTGT